MDFRDKKRFNDFPQPLYMSNYCHGLTERGNKLVEQQMLQNCIILYSHVEDLPSPPQSPGLKPRFQPRPDYYRLLMINHHISQASLIAGGIRRVRLCKVEFCVPTSLAHWAKTLLRPHFRIY